MSLNTPLSDQNLSNTMKSDRLLDDLSILNSEFKTENLNIREPCEGFELSLKPLPNCSRTIFLHKTENLVVEDNFNMKKYLVHFFRISWVSIDIFVSFTEYFITIPSLPWICISHVNGVPILGTINLTGSKNEEFAEQFLSDTESINLMAQNLIKVCLAFKFDGWFIYIKNVKSEDTLDRFVRFVKMLKTDLMAAKCNSLVIVSEVIKIKVVDWLMSKQEELVMEEICDGYYIRSAFNSNTIEENYSYSTEEFKLRLYFELNMKGCFDAELTETNLKTLRDLRSEKLSVSFFRMPCLLTVNELIDDKNYVWKINNTWEKIINQSNVYAVDSMPFWTNFSFGSGRIFSYGCKVVYQIPWINISLQRMQIKECGAVLLNGTKHENECKCSLEHFNTIDADTSLRFNVKTLNNADEIIIIHNLLLPTAYKVVDNIFLEYSFDISDDYNKYLKTGLVAFSKNHKNAICFVKDDDKSKLEKHLFKEYQHLNTHLEFGTIHAKPVPSYIFPTFEPHCKWEMRHTSAITPQQMNYIESIWLITYTLCRGTYSFYIGDLKIVNVPETESYWDTFKVISFDITNLRIEKQEMAKITCDLIFTYKYDHPSFSISYFDIFISEGNNKHVFNGRTAAKGFYEMNVSFYKSIECKMNGSFSDKNKYEAIITIQPINNAGYRLEPLSECPKYKRLFYA